MRKKLFYLMALLISLFMPFSGNKNTPVKVNADRVVDNVQYAIAGKFQKESYIDEWNYNTPYTFWFSNTDGYNGVFLDLKAGDEFRVLWKENGDEAWSKEHSFGYDETNLSDEVKTCFAKSESEDANFVATKDGTFIIKMMDEEIYPYAKRMGVEEKIYYKINIYDFDGTLIETEEFSEGEELGLPFYNERPGYKFIGWFLDPEFTTPFVAGPQMVNHDIDVYLCLVPAENYTIYINDENNVLGDNPYIYMWRTYDELSEMEEPGDALTKNSDGNYPYFVDIMHSYDRLVLSDGNNVKTIDFDASNLKDGDILYVTDLNSDGKYNIVLKNQSSGIDKIADEFANEWANMRKNGGASGICAYLTSSENTTLSDLLKKYMSYDDATKEAIRAKSDGDNVTIGETLDYIRMMSEWANNILTTSSSELNGVIITQNTNENIIGALFLIVSIIFVSSSYYLINKKQF